MGTMHNQHLEEKTRLVTGFPSSRPITAIFVAEVILLICISVLNERLSLGHKKNDKLQQNHPEKTYFKHIFSLFSGKAFM